ncbi:MAG: hypothetical protein LBQ50_03395, partial [Planctomycetaceae bacterium]|nr:hypothetical protein [Planctomycetaceae bacterium]
MSTSTVKLIAENPDQTLDHQINETRRFIRHIDFSLSFLSLLTILLAVSLIAILADHWLFADGLSRFLRFGVFLGLLLIVVFYVYRRIVPLFLYPINPVYAANLLEESSPSLKNSIVNWILLRKERFERGDAAVADKLAERMFDGVTQTAASGVKTTSSERAVDLRSLTRWGIALTLCFLFFVIYGVFSPKNPLTSLTRIMLPLSSIERPQAVRFLNIEPGNTVALQGEKLTISAEVVGQSNEPVYLFFSTDDGQAVRQAIPMSLPEGKTRHEVLFPPGKQGFACGVDYRIAQGESRSGTFRIDVRPTASIEIVSLKYRFPPYTGLPDETIENSGDIRAVEGTDVKIGVRSTIPLQRVDLVFDNDSVRTVGMNVSESNPVEATATITLKLDPQSTTPTTIRNFSFRATDREGYENRRSGVFRLEVLPDKPPMVQWADTDEKLKEMAQLDLPLNSSLELPIQAEDRDFGLRYLRFHVESGNKRIRALDLLESPATGATEHKGLIHSKAVFSPITSRLAEGDTAEIWAEAVDTKFPDPNSATTRRITVRIIAPQKQEQPPKEDEKKTDKKEEKQNKEQDKEQKKDQNQDKENKQNKNQENQQDPAQEQTNKPGSKPSEKPESGKENAEKQPPDDSDSQNGQNKNEPKQESDKQGLEPDKQEGTSNHESSDANENPSEKSDDKTGDKTDSKQNDSDKENPKQENSKQENDDLLQNGSRDNGEQKKNQNNQPTQEEQGDSSKNGDRNNSKKPINPETQDGDAMEEIIKQMKKEGKFDDNKLKEQSNNDQNGNNQDEKKQNEKNDKNNDVDNNNNNNNN